MFCDTSKYLYAQIAGHRAHIRKASQMCDAHEHAVVLDVDCGIWFRLRILPSNI